jgi:hypothetical protein
MSEKLKFHQSDDPEAGGALQYGEKEEFFTKQELEEMNLLPKNELPEPPKPPKTREPYPYAPRKSSFQDYIRRLSENEKNK